MLNISITVFDKNQHVEAVYVRSLNGSEVDTKDLNSIKEYVDDFLCADAIDNFTTIEFSPFGKFASFKFKTEQIENKILVTWEHTQS